MTKRQRKILEKVDFTERERSFLENYWDTHPKKESVDRFWNAIMALLNFFPIALLAGLFYPLPKTLTDASALAGFLFSILLFVLGVFLFLIPASMDHLQEAADEKAENGAPKKNIKDDFFLTTALVSLLAPWKFLKKVGVLLDFVWAFMLVLVGHWFVGFALGFAALLYYVGLAVMRTKTKEYIETRAAQPVEKVSAFE